MQQGRKGKTLYTGKEIWVNQATGEVREVDTFEKPVGRGNGFMITYLAEIINLIETLGNKKMLVVKYILEHMSKTENTLIRTQREIADALGMSTKTVNETLKLLADAGIIERRTGAIMVSPKLMNNWKAPKEASMMIKYYEFSGDDDNQITGQMEIKDVDCNIE
ncbi:MAG: replication/maintenance protein RepL [Mediterraneibacter faecis]